MQVGGQAKGLFAPTLPRVRVEARMGDEVVGEGAQATYGFADTTRDIELQLTADDERTIETNTIFLLMREDVPRGVASVVLVDAVTGVILQRLDDIEVNILG